MLAGFVEFSALTAVFWLTVGILIATSLRISS
jgi:hypothetical protein